MQTVIIIILILFATKSVMLGSEYNFHYHIKYGAKYHKWYFNRPTFSDYLKGNHEEANQPLSKEEKERIQMIAYNSYHDFSKYAANKILELYKQLGEAQKQMHTWKSAFDAASQMSNKRYDYIGKLEDRMKEIQKTLKYFADQESWFKDDNGNFVWAGSNDPRGFAAFTLQSPKEGTKP